MKKIILIALALVSLNSYSQADEKSKQRERHREGRSERAPLSAEERASLKTKQMTLKYDLTESQQRKIKDLNLAEAKKHQSMMEERRARREADREDRNERVQRISHDRYKIMNERLDAQIERKAKMKDILNEEQFQKWEKAQESRPISHRHHKKRHKGDHKKHRSPNRK